MLEVLIVLVVFGVMMALVTPIVTGKIEDKKITTFFEALDYDMLYMQRVSAMTSQRVTFFVKSDCYEIKKHRVTILTREIPSGITVDPYLAPSLAFTSEGRIRQPLTLRIRTKSTTYRYVFPFGKGRGYLAAE